MAVLALRVQLPALGDDGRRTAHHLDVQRRRILRRQGNEGGGVAVPVAEVAVEHASAVVLERAVITAGVPLLLQACGHLVDVVDLIDGHALVGEVQHLVVEVGVHVALPAHDFLDAGVAPAGPGV